MTGVQVADPDSRRKLIEYLDSDVFNHLAEFTPNE